MKVAHVVGARPNFMKAAPVIGALARRGIEQTLIHTGQHYDATMSDVFFRELALPWPDVHLHVGSGTHGFQTAEVMRRIEPVMQELRPDLLLVYGDVNSTLAAALVAAKLGMRIGHVEAGLRSFDRSMPEEINRVLTDQLADLLFTHSPEANANLLREGRPGEMIHFVGNVMIDTLLTLLPLARESRVLETLGLTDNTGQAVPYVLVTLHRPSNVDEAGRLRQIIGALKEVAAACRVVFPVHPRTKRRLSELGVPLSSGNGSIHLVAPLGYLDFLHLEEHAGAVVTDSGGVQEETTYLRVPCFTVRKNTERPVTVTCGTNRLVGDEVAMLPVLVAEALANGSTPSEVPQYWDGRAAERIAQVVSALAA